MSLTLPNEWKEAIEAEWPNHREVLGVWLPKSKVLIYNARDDSQLNVLLSRIPKEWSEAAVLPFSDWFKLTDHKKEQYIDKHLILTRYIPREGICHVPGYLFFLPYSVIAEEQGRFTDIRDQSGWKWGSHERRILSREVLNGEVVL
jgi:hypothetical protein